MEEKPGEDQMKRARARAESSSRGIWGSRKSCISEFLNHGTGEPDLRKIRRPSKRRENAQNQDNK